MEPGFQPKPTSPDGLRGTGQSFSSRFWLITVVIIVLLAGTVVFFTTSTNKAREEDERKQNEKEKNSQTQVDSQEMKDIREGRKPPMTSDELAKAEAAFTAGISIDDLQNDYVKVGPGTIQADGRPDNSSPWPVPFTDLKKAQIGADETYLYTKYTFYDIFPTEMYRNGEDFLAGIGVNLGLKEYFNHNLNKTDESALFQTGITYAANSNKDALNGEYGSFFNPPKLGTSTFGQANSKIKDKNNEDTYGIGTDAGKTFGGAGYDYMIAAFPLSNLGLIFGDTITFDISCESGSKVYHHQSIDPLLDFGSAKSGQYIIYKIGSNTFTSIIPKY